MLREFDYENELYASRANEFLIADCENILEIIDDLEETLKAHPERPYLCANEIGYDKRIICVRVGESLELLFNPIFQKIENHRLVRVKDYALDKDFIIPVCSVVEVAFQNKDGGAKAGRFEDEAAFVLYEAINCLEGIHPSDIGLEILPEFDEATEDEQSEIIAIYAQSLVDFYNETDMELRDDPELKAYWNSYRFNQARADGTIEVEEKTQLTGLNRKQRRFLDKIARRAEKKEKKYVN